MKPNFKLRSFLAGSAFLTLIHAAQAQTDYYWDPNGDGTPGFGSGAGTWGTSNFWNTDSTGGAGTLSTTIPDASNIANFGTSADGFNTGGDAATGTVTVSGTQNVGGITVGSASGPVVLSGGTINIASGGTISNNSTATTIFSTGVTGGDLIINNGSSSTVQFSGTGSLLNNTGSVQIDSGTINLTSNTNIGANITKFVVNGSSAKLRFTGGNTINTAKPIEITENGGIISRGGTGSSNLSGTFTATGTGNRTLTLENNATNTAAGTLSGSFILADPGTGRLSLNKTGSKTWILSIANSLSGSTTITAGVLSLTNANALQNSYIDTAASVTGDADNGLLLTGTALNIGGLTGDKSLSTIFRSAGGYGTLATLTLNVASGSDLSYSGSIGNGGGGLALTKSGDGKQTLSGACTYIGTTTISGGTLALGADNVLFDSTDVSIGTATLDAAIFDDTVNTLDVTGAATINLGAGANLVFSGGGTATWAGTLNLTGTFVPGDNTDAGTNPGSLRFGTDTNGLTGAQLDAISATGWTNFALDDYGFLTATPSGGGDDFDSWAGANGITGGENDDDDNDGVSNLVEYALADGQERGSLSGNTLTFSKRGAPYGGDITYIIETSTTLDAGSWTAEVTQGPSQLGDPLTYTFTPGPGTPKEFARLKVTKP